MPVADYYLRKQRHRDPLAVVVGVWCLLLMAGWLVVAGILKLAGVL